MNRTRVIYKYQMKAFNTELEIEGRFVPQAVTTVEMQGGYITLWTEVSPDEKLYPIKKRKFYIKCTGETYNAENLYYIGTVQKGEFVLHVFEYIPYSGIT